MSRHQNWPTEIDALPEKLARDAYEYLTVEATNFYASFSVIAAVYGKKWLRIPSGTYAVNPRTVEISYSKDGHDEAWRVAHVTVTGPAWSDGHHSLLGNLPASFSFGAYPGGVEPVTEADGLPEWLAALIEENRPADIAVPS